MTELAADELVRVLTDVMRKADRKFEKVGGSTRHHVRDCLIPELEQAGLAVVRVGSLSATRWVYCEERMPEAGQFAWIVWHGVVQEQPWEYTELDDGRMGWVHVESEITDGVSMWMPISAPPSAATPDAARISAAKALREANPELPAPPMQKDSK